MSITDITEQKNRKRGQRDAAQTRQLLLDAAKRLFTERSFSHVSTREIAAAAGVNLTLINRYFGSKKGLFQAVLDNLCSSDEEVRDMGTLFQRGINSVTDFLSKEDNERKHHRRLILLSILAPEVSDLMAERFQRFFRLHAPFVAGADKETRITLYYSLYFGLAISLLLAERQGLEQLNQAYIADFLKDTVNRLYADPASGDKTLEKNESVD